MPLEPGREEKGSVLFDFLVRTDAPSSGTGLRATLPWPVRTKTLGFLLKLKPTKRLATY